MGDVPVGPEPPSSVETPPGGAKTKGKGKVMVKGKTEQKAPPRYGDRRGWSNRTDWGSPGATDAAAGLCSQQKWRKPPEIAKDGLTSRGLRHRGSGYWDQYGFLQVRGLEGDRFTRVAEGSGLPNCICLQEVAREFGCDLREKMNSLYPSFDPSLPSNFTHGWTRFFYSTTNGILFQGTVVAREDSYLN